jgi:hypothetical protein
MHVAPQPEYPETPRLYASTQGWWRLVNGYSGFTPGRQRRLGDELAGFPDPRSLEALRDLGKRGVTYLIVHPDQAPLDRDQWEEDGRWQVERRSTLVPLGWFGADELYLINPEGDGLLTASGEGAADSGVPAPILERIRFHTAPGDAELWLLGYWQPVGVEAGSGGAGSSAETAISPELRLTLYWQTPGPLDTDYTVFVHSLASDGTLLGQADGPPVGGHYPTSLWLPGEIVQDSRLVPQGSVYLVGLYDPATGERLTAFDGQGNQLADDALRIALDPP